MDITGIGQPPEWPRKTALQKLHEETQRQLAPLHQIQEMQDLVKRYSPDHQMQELLRQFEPHRQIRELLAHTAIPKNIQDIIDGTSIAAQAQRMAKQYLNPIWEQQEYFNRVHREVLGGLTSKELTSQLAFANPTFLAMEAAKKSLDNLWESFRDIDFSQFEDDEEDQQEVVMAVQDITQAAMTEPTIKEAVDQIIAAIEAQQHPSVRLRLWLFFKQVMDWIIGAAIAVAITPYAQGVLGQSPQAETKAMKEIARQAIGVPELLIEYRYISAKVVIVRKNPKARSPELARLAFGKSVKLLKKEGDFTLVVWSDQGAGVEIQGWVFSRYLAKFN